jgi:hypothetical protein
LPSQLQSAAVAHRARDYLYAHIGENVGLSDLARETGTDRFTLTRCFKREFTWRHTHGLFSCVWQRPDSCWRAVTSPLMWLPQWVCRSKPSGALVPACIPYLSCTLPTVVHKPSRRFQK